ncbi:MAG: S1 family peptidase [Candidatus Ozemobacteraceae bacterium]
MNVFTQLVLVIGRIETNMVNMLGTGFLITNDGKIVTSRHVVGQNDKNLVILFPHIDHINNYQDTSDTSCKPIPVSIIEADPFRDLVILKADISFVGKIPQLGSFDTANVGDEVGIFGFPHCVEGRRVLTFQKAEVGAKILLESKNIKSKHAVINIQSRPGQSGSLVFHPTSRQIAGVLLGAFAPNGGGISLGGINPRELHQTTHCISAEYINDML